MLVLSRKEGEKLVIDGNIIITVVRFTGGRVKIGIDAPPGVSIKREELLHRSQTQQLASSGELLLPEHPAPSCPFALSGSMARRTA